MLVPARRPDEAREVLGGPERRKIQVGELDLSDQASVAAYAEHVLADGTPLDIVVNNAGIMATPETRTPEGWELQFATNHLGHYALVNRLWPLLSDHAGGARVVSVSSGGHQFSDIRWDDPWFDRSTSGYDKWKAYGQSKTANALFAVHLDAVGRAHGVRAWSLHPGAILTPLGRHLQAEDLSTVMVADEKGELVLPEFKTPEQGAATSVWAAHLAGRPGLRRPLPRGRRARAVVLGGRRTALGRRGRQGLRPGPGVGRPPLGLVGRAHRGRRVQLTDASTATIAWAIARIVVSECGSFIITSASLAATCPSTTGLGTWPITLLTS